MQYSQEHFKTMVYAKFGGQTECIMGNWKIENSPEVQSIRIVTHDLLAQLSSLAFFSFPEFRFIGFKVTMEDD